MRISGKQAHVLQNLERVRPHPYKIVVNSPTRRYQLDGWDCTAQITGLTVKNLVEEKTGALVRGPRLAFSVGPQRATSTFMKGR